MPLARARGGASQEGLVSLLGAERMRLHFVVAVAGAGVAGRNEVVTKLIAQTRLIAVATSELPANLSGTRTQRLLDERIGLP